MNAPYNPYAPPAESPPRWGYAPATPQGYVFILGDDLVIYRGSVLPHVCLKCGAPPSHWRSKTFVWTPPWAYFTMLLGWLIGLIVILATQQRMPLHVPLCQPCNQRWTQGAVAGALAVVGFLAALLGIPIAAIALDAGGTGILVALAVGLVVGIGGIILVTRTVVRPRLLWPRKIDKQYLFLRGVDARALGAIGEFVARAQTGWTGR